MSTERTNITIQVSTKWEADVIQKWMQLKKGPEAVAEAMGKVGQKGKQAGTVMDTITKGWQSDFKNIVRGLTGVGLAFKALDGIIAGLRYGITTFIEQTKASQQGAATQMGSYGATMAGMLRMAGPQRIRREMGMSPEQFAKHLGGREWGGMEPAAVNQMLQVVFSQLQGISMPMAIDAVEAMLTKDPTMTAGDIEGLMLAINPIINKGGAFEGDPKAAVAFLLSAVQQSVIPNIKEFGITAAPVLKQLTLMGTPEGKAARQKQLEDEWEAGGRQGPRPNAKITDTARVVSGVIMGQGDAGDIHGRQVANAMLAAMQNLPRIYEMTGYKGGYSDVDRARIQEVKGQGFDAFWEEITSGKSRAAQDTRMIYGDLAMISELSHPAAGTATPADLDKAIERIKQALPAMDDAAAATFGAYLQKAEEKQQRYLELLSRTGGLQIETGAKGELKGALPIGRFFSDPAAAADIFDKLPTSAEAARQGFEAEFGVHRMTQAGSFSAMQAKTKRALAKYQSENLIGATADRVANMMVEAGIETRDVTAPVMSIIARARAGGYDNTEAGVSEFLSDAEGALSRQAAYQSSQKRFTPAYTGMYAFRGAVREPTATELNLAGLFQAQAESLKNMQEELKQQTELLRQANEPKEMTLQGGTGIRAPAQSKVPDGSPFNSATVVPYPTGYSDLEVDP